ncbi:hypothetical protein Hanom_Chr01g00087301 [Helianthus anomalus]
MLSFRHRNVSKHRQRFDNRPRSSSRPQIIRARSSGSSHTNGTLIRLIYNNIRTRYGFRLPISTRNITETIRIGFRGFLLPSFDQIFQHN